MGVILEIKEVIKKFGALHAVQRLSMDVNEGEVHALIGPNGAGKTTLFNIVSGFFSADQGQIIFGGVEISGWESYRINRKGLSRSFQITNIFQGLTVQENIRIGCQASKKGLRMFSKAENLEDVNKKAEEVLKVIGLSNERDQLAGNLSHGDQRRVEIGLALASEPKLLLLDEPTAGMTPAETKEAMDVIAKLKKKATILLIEHDMDVVMGLSDVITVMQQGTKIAEGTPNEIRENEKVIEAYFGEVEC